MAYFGKAYGPVALLFKAFSRRGRLLLHPALPEEVCPAPPLCMGLALRLAGGRWEDMEGWESPPCPASFLLRLRLNHCVPLKPPALFVWLPGISGSSPQRRARRASDPTGFGPILSHLPGVHLSCPLDLGPSTSSCNHLPDNCDLEKSCMAQGRASGPGLGLAARWLAVTVGSWFRPLLVVLGGL